jgi:hypothetical protein
MIRFSLVFAATLFASVSVAAQQPASMLPRLSDFTVQQTATVFGNTSPTMRREKVPHSSLFTALAISHYSTGVV